MDGLEKTFAEAVDTTRSMLEESADDGQYISAILEVIREIKECTESQVRELPYDEAVLRGIRTDKGLLGAVVTKEADQVSLISTLVTYEYSRECGLPNHSRKYMDWVSTLREVIERYYETKAQVFC